MFDLGPEAVKGLLYSGLAAGGGLLGYLMRTLENESEKIHVGKALVQTLASGFTGYLTVLLCSSLGMNGPFMGVVVGVFGWMGASATIALLEKFVYKRLGLTPEIEMPAKEDDDDEVRG